MDLDERLEAYAAEDIYPFHMPGHKRRGPVAFDPYRIDLTEIEGFDDLHAPAGPIRELEARLAGLYHCPQAYLLVNGSTAGILSAVFAMTRTGDHILMARGCHRSVYHAAVLRRLRTSYLAPGEAVSGGERPVKGGSSADGNDSGTEGTDAVPSFETYAGLPGVSGGVTPAEVEAALCRYPDIKLLVLTYPTYEGVLSNIYDIIAIAHARRIPVLIDGAHGAHFGFHLYFPAGLADSGADVIVTSLHKTLPFLTQTAAILLPEGSGADRDRLREALRIFQTSSPSYVLMAAAAKGVRFLETEGPAAFAAYAKRLQRFYRNTRGLRYLHVYAADCPKTSRTQSPLPTFAENPPFSVVDAPTSTPSGGKFSSEIGKRILHTEFLDSLPDGMPACGLPQECGADGEQNSGTSGMPEDASESPSRDPGKIVIDARALPGGGRRLGIWLREHAGIELEMTSFSYGLAMTSVMDTQEGFDRLEDGLRRLDKGLAQAANARPEQVPGTAPNGIPEAEIKRLPAAVLSIADALEKERRRVEPKEAPGCIASGFLELYPPGVPIVVPGEIIGREQITLLEKAAAAGYGVRGMEDGRIPVLAE